MDTNYYGEVSILNLPMVTKSMVVMETVRTSKHRLMVRQEVMVKPRVLMFHQRTSQEPQFAPGSMGQPSVLRKVLSTTGLAQWSSMGTADQRFQGKGHLHNTVEMYLRVDMGVMMVSRVESGTF